MVPALIIVAIVIGVGSIVGVAAVLGYKAEKRRSEQLAQIASEMGFTYEAVAPSSQPAEANGLPLFAKGHSKKSRNVMRKLVRDRAVTLLDYQYTVGSGKNRQTYSFTAAVFSGADGDNFVDFELRPENVWHKIGSYFGYQDIDFESHPIFSQAYLLRGQNEPAIREQFTPTILDFFEKLPGRWFVEARSARMVVYRKRATPEELKQFLIDATKVFLLFVPS